MATVHYRWLVICLPLLASVLYAEEPTEEELERWFQSDESGPPQTNYGAGEQLEFRGKLIFALTYQAIRTEAPRRPGDEQ